jgi:DNA modification methylase
MYYSCTSRHVVRMSLRRNENKCFYVKLYFSKLPKEIKKFTNISFDLVVTSSGYHNRLGERTERHKQSLWVVIRVLKDEERLVRLAAQRVGMGFSVPPKKLKYRKLEHRIRKLKRQYRHGHKSLHEYWGAVTHLVCRVN